MLLSLDQSFRVTGYSVFKIDKLVDCGTWEIPPTDSIGDRLDLFMSHLDDMGDKLPIDEVVFEGIQLQMGNADTFKKLSYVQAMLIYWCNKHNIEYEIMPPSHWRKILTDRYGIKWGRKRAEQKSAALEFAKIHSNIMNLTEDMADSYCIGLASIIERQTPDSAFK